MDTVVSGGRLERWFAMAPIEQSRTYRSEAAAAVHEMIEGIYQAGLSTEQNMGEFDASCLALSDQVLATESSERE
ncbi:hypothetical protein [Methylobacterium iners]|uniref:CopG family transcriptional regulator n=1 Tax=Methylobacterium iners TaxID=418707 RepID=A0ABQ4S433_9HYPH|nr:hypothetical protein [Methylobacterium iners]GJD97666.1 hypothetical protein OCOJLMKI_4899 [Methylobacterium iners]